MSNRLIMFIISLVSLVFIVEISRSIYSLWQKGGIVAKRQEEQAQLQKIHDDLQKKLVQVQSPEFIERQAREKLNLQKEGELVVVLPHNLSLDQPHVGPEANLPNWQRWWKLFF